MRLPAAVLAALLATASPLLADSVEEAVARLEASCEAGDVEALASGFGAKGGDLFRRLVASMQAQDDEEAAWFKALDERFGADPQARRQAGLVEQLTAGFRLVRHVSIAGRTEEGNSLRLTLKVTRADRLDPAKTTDSEELWDALLQDGSWTLTPKGFFEDTQAMQAEQERMGRLLEAAARVRAEVASGKYSTREEAMGALDQEARRIRAEGGETPQAWADPEVLQAVLKGAIAALQRSDRSAAARALEGLVLPEAPLWFEDAFGVVNGAKASAAYDAEQVVVGLIATLSGAIEAGRTDPWVYTLTQDEDDHTAAIYAAMAQPFDLLVVDLNTPGEFQGGTRIAYFVFVDGSFRFVGELKDVGE